MTRHQAGTWPTTSASGRSTVEYSPNPLTTDQRIRRALAITEAEVIRLLIARRARRTGRPRLIPLSAIFAALCLHVLDGRATMSIADVTRTLKRLTPQQRATLGIPGHIRIHYKRVLSGVHAILQAARDGILADHDHDLVADEVTGEVEDCPPTCPFTCLSLDKLGTLIVQSGIAQNYRPPATIAIDGTDIESAIRSRPKTVGPDGHERVAFDHDVRWGKRTATDRRPSELYVGYEAHLATYAPEVGDDPIPQLAAGLALRPGVTDRVGAALGIIDALGTVKAVLLDRGYTTSRAANLARPLRERRIAVTMDLHTTQRGTRPGPMPGTVWVDGALYTDALPEPLRHLEPPQITHTAADKARIRDLFDKREPYRFTPLARRHEDRGSQRFKGPALAGHLRCPNTPGSIRLGRHLPTATCTRGAACACGRTVTVADTELERDRQPLPWQSNRWALSFNRRSLIEGLNASIRCNTGNVNRGFIRIAGLVSHTILLAITLAAHNIQRLHDWHESRHLPDPWQIELGEEPSTEPLDRHTRTRGRSPSRL